MYETGSVTAMCGDHACGRMPGTRNLCCYGVWGPCVEKPPKH